jgi:hypothetical protein
MASNINNVDNRKGAPGKPQSAWVPMASANI